MSPHSERLREILEAAYREHHSHAHRERDPLSLVHRYENPRDQEIVGLFCALLAYGNVRSILNSAAKVLTALGPRPAETVRAGLWEDSLGSFRHRFTTGEDLQVLFHWLHRALNSHGTLEAFFVGETPPELPLKERLSGFVTRLKAQPLPEEIQTVRDRRVRQLRYLISDPSQGSACKRLNMYLRWMVREADGIDLGLWKRIPAASLILPLDTHLLKTIRRLRWTRSQQASWKVAEQATARLRRYCPEDPVRYDFALCHLSMSGGRLDL